MTDHYDTLGVPRDASAEDIKTAFRRIASAEHPDKGGDGERMADANRAYETLGDAARRAEYDATGGDDGAARFEREARDRLMHVFDTVLGAPDEHADLMAAARLMLSTAQRQIFEERGLLKRRIAKLTKHRGRVLRKGGGENLFTGLIDSQVQQLSAQLQALEHGAKVFARVAELLGEYEMAPGALPQFVQPGYAATNGMFNGLSGSWS
jgi:curved DNA-binding protein CbpA